jgi:hypothetical protein
MLLKKRWHGKFLNNIAGWPYILKITIKDQEYIFKKKSV